LVGAAVPLIEPVSEIAVASGLDVGAPEMTGPEAAGALAITHVLKAKSAP